MAVAVDDGVVHEHLVAPGGAGSRVAHGQQVVSHRHAAQPVAALGGGVKLAPFLAEGAGGGVEAQPARQRVAIGEGGAEGEHVAGINISEVAGRNGEGEV